MSNISEFFAGKKTYLASILGALVMILPMVGVSFSADDAALIDGLYDKVAVIAALAFTIYGRFVAKPE